jgi:hypothetical protein
VLVLGVVRADGSYVGAPRGEAILSAGDVVILYGRAAVFGDLDERRAGVGGQLRHAEAIIQQLETQAGESNSDSS